MRALCESCAKPQPADWRPGDLCVHCGLQVRQQVRCYWCSHWIPAGNFCRHCGAEGIAPDLYAPARMLKCYGSDMFSISKLLREMDPARVDTFRSIYGQHLGVAMRHIEELRELENELFSKHWSSELEEELIPQLPWPEKEFGIYSAPERKGRTSPFPIVASMANLVALRRGDFDLLPKIGPVMLSSSMRHDIDLEAALQISNWRVAGNTYLESLRYAAMACLRQAEPKTLLIQLSLAYLGERDVTVPEEALTSDDFEISFFAALMLGNQQTLIRALESPEPLRWMVAANKLIRLKRTDAIVDVLRRKASPEQQQKLVGSLQLEKRAVPELHEALFEIVDRNLKVNAHFDDKSKLARGAAGVICLGCTQPEAMRLAATLDWDILHSLALSKAIDPETFRAIGEFLVRENKMTMSEFAWTSLAAPGRMPQDFVESVFPSASTPERQIELLNFAEKQLEDLPQRPRGTSMERVLIRAAFGDHEAKVIGAAWCSLHRINYHREYASPSPFPYANETIQQFWTLPEFEERLARLQANEAALGETFVAEDLRRFLHTRPGA
jgi:hypothetical protein